MFFNYYLVGETLNYTTCRICKYVCASDYYIHPVICSNCFVVDNKEQSLLSIYIRDFRENIRSFIHLIDLPGEHLGDDLHKKHVIVESIPAAATNYILRRRFNYYYLMIKCLHLPEEITVLIISFI